MKKKDKVSMFAVIGTCICAIIWSILVFIDLYYGYPNKASYIFHIMCAVAWDISTFIWILRYIKSKKENE